MDTEELKPVTWLKAKHSRHKDKGRYKGGGGNTSKKTRNPFANPGGKKVKTSMGPADTEHVKVISADGHTRWATRPRVKR